MTADDARARLPTVTLHPARVWTCPACGRDNWRHVEVYEVNGRCERMPERVLCLTCGEVFGVEKGGPQGGQD